MHPTRTRFSVALAGLATAAVLTGCAGTGGSDDSAASTSDVSVAQEPAPEGDLAGRYDAGDSGALSDEVASGGDSTSKDGSPGDEAPGAPDVGTPAVIATGTVSLEAEDVGRARFDIRKIVDQFSGTVSEQETSTGEKGEVVMARLVIRVPSARFAEAQAALEEVATLTGSSAGAEDVTTEVIDIEARVRAQRKSVERIESLLARAKSLQELVSIESQLAGRQAELDSLVARQKWLADQTSLSTLTVYVEQPREKAEKDDDESDSGFLSGLRDGWDSFVDGGGAVLTVIGFALPWLGLLLLLGLPFWLLLRRRGSRRPANPPVTPPTSPTA
ncbi:hypothetical protein ASE01_07630 [Nocardioides sp. Root190]|uniref:DUF4349 domain-containing protein n=1 Tax=Nocardioides sp. Root190 TaxID=1736488 RepID=UPI0006FE9578|nr:DUF4349 domain-containing protein [Nocardioides sp. Root190]KRB78031.1 hypothetical protein ASE01_07630 [Nocardioides sp. Root190]